jgi:hypothetical protein
MKAIPAVMIFLVVYYTLWFLVMPVRVFRQFLIALTGDE